MAGSRLPETTGARYRITEEDWIMDCFLVLITSPMRPIPEEFGKRHIPIGDSAVIVAADDMTG